MQVGTLANPVDGRLGHRTPDFISHLFELVDHFHGALAQLKLGGLQAGGLIDLIQEFAGQDACFQDTPGQDCHPPVTSSR